MQSDRKKMWKEAGILFAITLIAGLALGFVHELTKEPIAVQQQLKIQNSCKAVFADADHFTVAVTVKVKPEGAKRPKLEEQELTFAYDEIKYTKYLISFK